MVDADNQGYTMKHGRIILIFNIWLTKFSKQFACWKNRSIMPSAVTSETGFLCFPFRIHRGDICQKGRLKKKKKKE